MVSQLYVLELSQISGGGRGGLRRLRSVHSPQPRGLAEASPRLCLHRHPSRRLVGCCALDESKSDEPRARLVRAGGTFVLFACVGPVRPLCFVFFLVVCVLCSV